MNPAASRSEFVAEPVGRYFAGDTSLVWCAAPSIIGSAFWGRPSEADARQCVPLYDCDGSPQITRPYDVVTDARRVTSVDPNAFQIFFEYIGSRRADYAARVRRWALVLAPGTLPGAALGGSFQQLATDHPWRAFTSPPDAFAWLERPDSAVLCVEVEALVERTIDLPPLLRRLREHIALSPRDGLVETARALLVSPRNLQRELKQANTSFTNEVLRARIKAAAILLADTDLKIDVVAMQVGCASGSHLYTLFERFMGETPSAYRSRHRTDLTRS